MPYRANPRKLDALYELLRMAGVKEGDRVLSFDVETTGLGKPLTAGSKGIAGTKFSSSAMRGTLGMQEDIILWAHKSIRMLTGSVEAADPVTILSSVTQDFHSAGFFKKHKIWAEGLEGAISHYTKGWDPKHPIFRELNKLGSEKYLSQGLFRALHQAGPSGENIFELASKEGRVFGNLRLMTREKLASYTQGLAGGHTFMMGYNVAHDVQYVNAIMAGTGMAVAPHRELDLLAMARSALANEVRNPSEKGAFTLANITKLAQKQGFISPEVNKVFLENFMDLELSKAHTSLADEMAHRALGASLGEIVKRSNAGGGPLAFDIIRNNLQSYFSARAPHVLLGQATRASAENVFSRLSRGSLSRASAYGGYFVGEGAVGRLREVATRAYGARYGALLGQTFEVLQRQAGNAAAVAFYKGGVYLGAHGHWNTFQAIPAQALGTPAQNIAIRGGIAQISPDIHYGFRGAGGRAATGSMSASEWILRQIQQRAQRFGWASAKSWHNQLPNMLSDIRRTVLREEAGVLQKFTGRELFYGTGLGAVQTAGLARGLATRGVQVAINDPGFAGIEALPSEILQRLQGVGRAQMDVLTKTGRHPEQLGALTAAVTEEINKLAGPLGSAYPLIKPELIFEKGLIPSSEASKFLPGVLSKRAGEKGFYQTYANILPFSKEGYAAASAGAGVVNTADVLLSVMGRISRRKGSALSLRLNQEMEALRRSAINVPVAILDKAAFGSAKAYGQIMGSGGALISGGLGRAFTGSYKLQALKFNASLEAIDILNQILPGAKNALIGPGRVFTNRNISHRLSQGNINALVNLGVLSPEQVGHLRRAEGSIITRMARGGDPKRGFAQLTIDLATSPGHQLAHPGLLIGPLGQRVTAISGRLSLAGRGGQTIGGLMIAEAEAKAIGASRLMLGHRHAIYRKLAALPEFKGLTHRIKGLASKHGANLLKSGELLLTAKTNVEALAAGYGGILTSAAGHLAARLIEPRALEGSLAQAIATGFRGTLRGPSGIISEVPWLLGMPVRQRADQMSYMGLGEVRLTPVKLQNLERRAKLLMGEGWQNEAVYKMASTLMAKKGINVAGGLIQAPEQITNILKYLAPGKEIPEALLAKFDVAKNAFAINTGKETIYAGLPSLQVAGQTATTPTLGQFTGTLWDPAIQSKIGRDRTLLLQLPGAYEVPITRRPVGNATTGKFFQSRVFPILSSQVLGLPTDPLSPIMSSKKELRYKWLSALHSAVRGETNAAATLADFWYTFAETMTGADHSLVKNWLSVGVRHAAKVRPVPLAGFPDVGNLGMYERVMSWSTLDQMLRELPEKEAQAIRQHLIDSKSKTLLLVEGVNPPQKPGHANVIKTYFRDPVKSTYTYADFVAGRMSKLPEHPMGASDLALKKLARDQDFDYLYSYLDSLMGRSVAESQASMLGSYRAQLRASRLERKLFKKFGEQTLPAWEALEGKVNPAALRQLTGETLGTYFSMKMSAPVPYIYGRSQLEMISRLSYYWTQQGKDFGKVRSILRELGPEWGKLADTPGVLEDVMQSFTPKQLYRSAEAVQPLYQFLLAKAGEGKETAISMINQLGSLRGAKLGLKETQTAAIDILRRGFSGFAAGDISKLKSGALWPGLAAEVGVGDIGQATKVIAEDLGRIIGVTEYMAGVAGGVAPSGLDALVGKPKGLGTLMSGLEGVGQPVGVRTVSDPTKAAIAGVVEDLGAKGKVKPVSLSSLKEMAQGFLSHPAGKWAAGIGGLAIGAAIVSELIGSGPKEPAIPPPRPLAQDVPLPPPPSMGYPEEQMPMVRPPMEARNVYLQSPSLPYPTADISIRRKNSHAAIAGYLSALDSVAPVAGTTHVTFRDDRETMNPYNVQRMMKDLARSRYSV